MAADADSTVTLRDNQASSLSFDTTGKTGLLVFKTSDGAEGATMSGTLAVTGTLATTADVSVGTDLVVNGNTTLGNNSASDTIVFTGRVTNAGIDPENDSGADLGTTALQWANAHTDAMTSTTGGLTISTATNGGALTLSSDGSATMLGDSGTSDELYIARNFVNSVATAITVGDVVCAEEISDNGGVGLAEADGAAGKARIFGICTDDFAASIGAAGACAMNGVVKINKQGTEVWKMGDPIYLHTTAGKGTVTAPTGSGEFVALLGYCAEDTPASDSTSRLVKLVHEPAIELP